MPYIVKGWRDAIDPALLFLQNTVVGSHNLMGEDTQFVIAYTITKIALEFIGDPKYSKINDVIGALDCCRMEFCRRKIYDGCNCCAPDLPIDTVKNTERIDEGIEMLMERVRSIEGFESNRGGILNYIMTMLILPVKIDICFTNQKVVEVFNFCKRMIYNNVAAPYEDKKIIENGDCY
jgi:hypothetical protein